MEWLDLDYILEVELIGFEDRLEVRESDRSTARLTPGFGHQGIDQQMFLSCSAL